MGYNTAIPQLSDPRAQSQGQILSNYQAINKVWADNHYPLTGDQNDSYQGMHTVLTLRPQSGDPNTASDQVALYNKLVTSIPQLFFKPNNNQTPIQLTYSSIKADSTDTQYTFAAGPFIIYGGKITNPTNGQVVPLSPGSGLLYAGVTTAGNVQGAFTNVRSAVATTLNTPANSFTINFQTGVTIEFLFYFAIGLP